MASTQYVKPALPASVVTFLGEQSISVGPTENSIVAIMGTADWGPLGTDAVPSNGADKGGTALYESLGQFEGAHGTNDTPARRAVVGAFNGIGTSRGGGAGGVVFYRLATSSAAAATKTHNNTAGTPAAALQIDALYKGTRGNDISYVVELDPLNAAKHRLRILFRGATIESYSYTSTSMTELAAAVNARSRFVKVTSLATGTALALTAGTPLTGGDNGASVLPADFTKAQTALSLKSFSILSVAGLTDASIKVQLAAWQRASADAMRPFRIVFGGAVGETVDTALAELTANPTLRDEQIVRVAGGTWHDDLLNLDLSTAELAPRIAGVLAARGEGSALTNAPLGGLRSVGALAPTDSERIVARDNGLTVFKAVSFAEAEVAVSQGVSTYIDKTKVAKPYDIFSEPRLVGILNRVQRYLSNWGEENIVGSKTVTDDTRSEVRKETLKVLGALEIAGLAKPNTSYANVEPSDDPGLKDAVPYEFGFQPTSTANYLIGVGKIRV